MTISAADRTLFILVVSFVVLKIAADVQNVPLQFVRFSAIPDLPFAERLLTFRDGSNVFGRTDGSRIQSLNEADGDCPADSECLFLSKCPTLRRYQPSTRCQVDLNQGFTTMRLPGGVCCRRSYTNTGNFPVLATAIASAAFPNFKYDAPESSQGSTYSGGKTSGHLVNFVVQPNSVPGYVKSPLYLLPPTKDSMTFLSGQAPVNDQAKLFVSPPANLTYATSSNVSQVLPTAIRPTDSSSGTKMFSALNATAIQPLAPNPSEFRPPQQVGVVNPLAPAQFANTPQQTIQSPASSQQFQDNRPSSASIPFMNNPQLPQIDQPVKNTLQNTQFNNFALPPVQGPIAPPQNSPSPQPPFAQPPQNYQSQIVFPQQPTFVQQQPQFAGQFPQQVLLSPNSAPFLVPQQNNPGVPQYVTAPNLLKAQSLLKTNVLQQVISPSALSQPQQQQLPSNVQPQPQQLPPPFLQTTLPPIPQAGQSIFCGVSDPFLGRSARILGGRPSRFGAWPWMAVIESSRRLRCGATILNEQFLVTAAHCVYKNYQYGYYEDLSIKIGLFNLEDEYDSDMTPTQQVQIHKVFVHPYFNSTESSYDVALIQVATSIKFRPNIKPVCLPSNEHLGEMGTVIGWGKRKESDDRSNLPMVLQEVNLPILYPWQCMLELRSNGILDDIGPQFICAGGKANQDACKGDSGGPLLASTNGQYWEIIGIVSKGYGCGKENVPGIYTNLFYLREWIEDTVSSNWNLFTFPSLFSGNDRNSPYPYR